jgi:glycosyltransferase involved in cell wall biosynthesis
MEASQDYIELDRQPVFIPWNPLSWIATYRAACKQNPDALIVKYWMPFFAPGFAAVCALLKRFTQIRTVFIIDNVMPHERRPGDRFMTRLAMRWVDGFIVQSNIVRRELYDWFPEAKGREVVYVPHPVYDCYPETTLSKDEARRELGLNPGGKVLLFFGLVRRYKGLDILLQALPGILNKSDENIHLLVAGEFYEPEEMYRRQVADLGLQDRVTIINQYIANEDIGMVFHAADLLVLPYRSATQSGVVQVAYNFGLPVVSTKVGGLPEVVREGETGFLVEPENPDQLGDIIVEYFRGNLGETMTENLRDARVRFSWDGMLDAIEALSGVKKGG